jgi:hypothetical protein
MGLALPDIANIREKHDVYSDVQHGISAQDWLQHVPAANPHTARLCRRLKKEIRNTLFKSRELQTKNLIEKNKKVSQKYQR